ncbi:DNA polymerase IV [Streptomyces microflavus]
MNGTRRLRPRAILRLHFHPAERNMELYGQLLAVVDGISSRVEPLPADWSAYVDLARRPHVLAAATSRALSLCSDCACSALHGVQCSAGAGPTRSIAAMAADVTPPGAAIVVRDDPYEIAAFLRTKPASALPGIGPKTARTLARYGITSVGDIADTQLPTLQRILGVTAARQAHDRSPRNRQASRRPGRGPQVLGSRSPTSDRDELDPEQHHRTVLRLVQELGARLRAAGEIAPGTVTAHPVLPADRHPDHPRAATLRRAAYRPHPAAAGLAQSPDAASSPALGGLRPACRAYAPFALRAGTASDHAE